jgi:aryl-alcohol dehydrogenase-like predicted oxidoreductase
LRLRNKPVHVLGPIEHLFSPRVNAGETVEGMRTRRLGSGGPEVSVLGLGCNNFGLRIGLPDTRDVVSTALELGINFFDTADLYGRTDSERFLGEALGARRDEVIIATKWGWSTLDGAPQRRSRGLFKHPAPRGSDSYIRWALEESLRRLGTDRVDLYQYHKLDEETPLSETFETLASLVREGKIRWVGLPPLAPNELQDAVSLARTIGLPLISMQLQYSLVRRDVERELLPLCDRLGIGVLPYLPLEGGLLTGKYRRGEPLPPDSRYASMPLQWPKENWLTDDAFDRVEALEEYASERGISLIDVAIGGLIAMPAVGSVIAGATRPEQVHANAQAARWIPDDNDLAALRTLRGDSAHSGDRSREPLESLE